jgi:protein TonB
MLTLPRDALRLRILAIAALGGALYVAGCAVPTDLGRVPAPAFSPMTVRPVLTNAPEVQQVLMREYPAVLRDAGIGGAPVVWLYIGTTGSVDATRIHESSGVEGLDQAAQAVARAMRFTPARNGDDVVAVWVQVPVRFAVVH